MTTEELLQVRFKVIANFPDSTRNIGDIIYVDNKKEKYWCEHYENWLSTFPHLFKKLEWWEERNIEDLPKYLKEEIEENKFYYYKVEKYIYKSNDLRFEWMGESGETYKEIFKYSKYLPSTEEEYLKYFKNNG